MNKDFVILLHGLARTSSSMKAMAIALEGAGFCTINYNYPSTKNTVEYLADNIINDVLSICPEGAKIHFVTHSMGGIILRQYLNKNTISTIGRVVMLAPPNKGSQIVDKLKHIPGYQWINGPAGMQLGTEEMSVPNSLGAANFELGVIAGTRSINLFLSTMLPKPDDGKVSVNNTKLEGMADHITFPVSHPFIMKHKHVINQTIHFLKHGEFRRPGVV